MVLNIAFIRAAAPWNKAEVRINATETGDERRTSADNRYTRERFTVMDRSPYNVPMLVFKRGRVCVLGDHRSYIGGL